MCMCVYVCVCVCQRACMHTCVCVPLHNTYTLFISSYGIQHYISNTVWSYRPTSAAVAMDSVEQQHEQGYGQQCMVCFAHDHPGRHPWASGSHPGELAVTAVTEPAASTPVLVSGGSSGRINAIRVSASCAQPSERPAWGYLRVVHYKVYEQSTLEHCAHSRGLHAARQGPMQCVECWLEFECRCLPTSPPFKCRRRALCVATSSPQAPRMSDSASRLIALSSQVWILWR